MASVNVHLHVGRGQPGPVSGTALRDAAALASAQLLGPAALQAELERVLTTAADDGSVYGDQFEGAVNTLVAAAQLLGMVAQVAADEHGSGWSPHDVVGAAHATLTSAEPDVSDQGR